jgi:hypothetical protein
MRSLDSGLQRGWAVGDGIEADYAKRALDGCGLARVERKIALASPCMPALPHTDNKV